METGVGDSAEATNMQRDDVSPWPSGEQSLTEEKSGRVHGASEEDMRILEANLHLHLHEWGPLLTAGQRLLVWERPLPSLMTAAALHGTFWLFSYLSPRPLFLLSLVLLSLLGIDWWKPWLLTRLKVTPRGEPSSDSEALPAVGGGGEDRLLSVLELCHYLAEGWFTFCQYVQEVLQYKKQNPGKFCAVVCSCCAVLTVLGYYIPGIMICYIILLSVLLWPLVVYRELIQRMYTTLEPVLMKLDYSMKGERLPRSHKKRQLTEPEGEELMAETDSESEIELSGFSPKLDVRITALALSITDSELSDEEASILESGGFSVSRATTPQLTDVSEDLDQPNLITEDVPPAKEPAGPPEWLGHPSSEAKESPVEELHSPQHDSLTLTPEELLPTLASPLHFVNTHFNGKILLPGLESEMHPLSAEMVSRAASSSEQRPPSPGAATGLALPETPDPEGDGEDFELLDQGELDLMQEEFEEAEKRLAANSSSPTPAVSQPDQEKPAS
uniref:RETREG1-3/ARL6IP-like N-terminal reticulon-homology domain-containing protein n=1 Tax=Leptobrachium leishanense TaxID=445787 RepID=A0A8C5WEI9_9ANUR